MELNCTHHATDIKNVTFRNFSLRNIRSSPVSTTQRIMFSGEAGDCNSSQFKIEDFTMVNVTGTVNEDPITIFLYSGAAPCENIGLNAINLELANGTAGVNCTGSTCGRSSADGTC